MNLEEFNFNNILEDNPIIFEEKSLNPIDIIFNTFNKNIKFKESNFYSINQIQGTLHSGFFNLKYKEVFIKLFSKRDEEYFKVILNKVLDNCFEDVIIYDIHNIGFNNEGNHRLMLLRLLEHYNLVESKNLLKYVNKKYENKINNLLEIKEVK